ncbi:MAG: hypothetical protein HY015_09705 [Bacteroidetes bacterium]|nr:hypothetical protein [Bacteroidota bacterium]MBI3483228.1 hypothetical protein [Bacteroidota bacterium]
MNSKYFGFKTVFITIGALQVTLSGLMFTKGIVPSMSQFGIPDEVLHSPHYYDAMLYVFYHQFVNGCVLLIVGRFAVDLSLRLWLTRILSVLYCIYTYFDFRASDSVFGNGLYKGSASVIPPLFTLFFTILILQLNFRKRS